MVTVVGRPVELVVPHATPGRRLLVLGADGRTPARVAELLAGLGLGASRLTALEQLGGPGDGASPGPRRAAARRGDRWWYRGRSEPRTPVRWLADARGCPTRRTSTTGNSPSATSARSRWPGSARCRGSCSGTSAPAPGRSPSSGARAPRVPGGRDRAGRGRAARIGRNATRLGVPGLRVVHGAAPAALAGLPAPDAVFVGGGDGPGVLDACWDALAPAGGWWCTP